MRVTEVLPAVRGVALAVGRDARGLRPERRRLGAAARARRRAGGGGLRPPRRGARARRARRPAAAHGEGDRHLSARRRRRGGPRADAHVPRLPLRRDRRRRGPRGRGRRGGRRRLGPAPHRLVRLLQRAAQPLPRERRLEHARQLPRRPDRLPAARRAARLDRRHPGLRARRHVPVRRGGLPELVAGRPGRRPEARRLGPLRHPRRAAHAGTHGDRLGRRRDDRAAVLHERTGDAAVFERQLRACAPGSTRSPRWPARTVCGPADSSSATGSTRRRRRTSPPRRRPIPTSWPRPTSRARPTSSPRRRSCSAGSTSPPTTSGWRSEVRGAFAREYVTEGGRVLSDSATVYALAIAWALLPTREQRDRAGARLADLVRATGFRIGTGFLGTPLIADALTQAGHVDVAYRLLLQEECPSWLYPVTMGATTVWERWDSMLPDGTINPGQMTSFNHYALGAVADWLHRTVAGLAPAAPGYRADPRPAAADAPADPRERPPPDAVRGRRGGAGSGRTGRWSCARSSRSARRRSCSARRRGADRGGPRQPRVESARLVGRRTARRRTSPRSGRSWITSRPGSRSSPPRRTSRSCRGRPRPPAAEALPRRARGTIVDALVPRGLAERGEELRERLVRRCWGSDAACPAAVRMTRPRL